MFALLYRACTSCCEKQSFAYYGETKREALGVPVAGVPVANDSEKDELSFEVPNVASMEYRNTDISFESDDRSGVVQPDDFDGELVDWDYENVHWDAEDSQSTAGDSAVEEVTRDVRRQSLLATPVGNTVSSGGVDMNVDSPRDSPELIDLTNTPSLARGSSKSSFDDQVIDLC